MNHLYARHRIDIRPSQLVDAVRFLGASDRERAARALEARWSPGGDALACYSVRSGFHLLLTALELPRGSEVLFSAVTHPDMPRIAEHHGLVPVPVDLEIDSLAPSANALLRCFSPRARVLVVAHLFGRQVALGPLEAVCRRAGIVVVEDCALAYDGPPDSGDPLAAVSMFSFGILKTATALGGAMLAVRDRALLGRMAAAQRA